MKKTALHPTERIFACFLATLMIAGCFGCFASLVASADPLGVSVWEQGFWYLKDLKVRCALQDAVRPTRYDSIFVSPGPYCPGNTFYVSIPFSETVIVTGTPTLDTNWGSASYIAGSGTNVLTFKGTILTGLSSARR